MKVSVAMITYNHERFIAQAIDGVLMQHTSFPFELVIGEDCSTDGTRAIVQQFGERNPDRIRLLLSDSNRGANANLAAVWLACSGQYVALCEGDDYWTDPNKLQRQVEFLDSHPQCAICFHDVQVVYETHARAPHRQCLPDQKQVSTLADLMLGNFIPTPSVVYRAGLVTELPDWYSQLPVGDWPLHALHAQHGDIGYINESMAAYRVHDGGVWSGREALARINQMLPVYGYLYNNLDAWHRWSVARGACRAIATGAALTLQAQPAKLEPSLAFVRESLRPSVTASYVDSAFTRTTWASSYEALGFVASGLGNARFTRYCFARSIALRPSTIHNGGVLSLLFKACFGTRASNVRRRAWNSICRR